VKVLVDTCAWSLLLRRKNKTDLSEEEQLLLTSLTEAIKDGRVAIIGPIRQEVLSGIRDLAQFNKLRSALAAFRDEPLTSTHFEDAARLFNLCRSHGVECGSTDILICTVAIQKHWTVLTNDGGIRRCIDVLKAEGLMQ
jgi:predicted nucleic acid-binding protein